MIGVHALALKSAPARLPAVVIHGYDALFPGALAQLGERRLCKAEVTGSIPVRSIVQFAAIFRGNTGENDRFAIVRPRAAFAPVRA